MTATTDRPSRQVILARVPEGMPSIDDFAVVDAVVPAPGPGQVRVRVLELSLDPYLRTAIIGRHLGEAAVPPGTLVPGRSVAVVEECGPPGPAPSGDAGLRVGDVVMAETGWREHAVLDAEGLAPIRVPEGVQPSHALGVLGMPGLTAYAAITRQIRPCAGETVVVSSATGGVGAVAGQLARLAGARTIAVVGSPEKAKIATSQLGYDVAVLRGSGFAERLAEATPDRVDGYLHMGDADTLAGVVSHLAVGARISLIGLMDQYNGGPPTTMLVGPIIGARATVHGMVVYDHNDLIDEQHEHLATLIRTGELQVVEDRYQGLDQAPEAFARLMAGHNQGKVIVEVST
ncbi:MAG: NADP-dependent oxidoreductase [Dermatophilaceae bacterium]